MDFSYFSEIVSKALAMAKAVQLKQESFQLTRVDAITIEPFWHDSIEITVGFANGKSFSFRHKEPRNYND